MVIDDEARLTLSEIVLVMRWPGCWAIGSGYLATKFYCLYAGCGAWTRSLVAMCVTLVVVRLLSRRALQRARQEKAARTGPSDSTIT